MSGSIQERRHSINFTPRRSFSIHDGRRRTSVVLRQDSQSIRQVPNELLSYIFWYTVHDENTRSDMVMTAPLVISHVSRRWRRVALTTGNLWTNIVLTFPLSTAQISRSLTWLSRSKNYALDILLDLRDPMWDWDEGSHAFRGEDMDPLLQFLLPHAARWRQFELLTDTWAPIHRFLSQTSHIGSTPMLENLALSRCNAYFASKGETFQPTNLQSPIALFGGIGLDRLQDLALVGVHVDWSNSSLRNLQSLDLKYHVSEVMPTLEEFIHMLSASPDLQSLSILGWGPRFNASSEVAIDETVADEPVHRIKMPNLTRFTLGIVDVEYAIKLLLQLCFPMLEELALEDVSKSLEPCEAQDTTRIFDFLTSDVGRACESPNLDIPFSLTRLTTLSLRGITSTPRAFQQFISKLSSLRRLDLADVESDILSALRPLSSGHPGVCPHLVELCCSRVDYSVVFDIVTARLDSRTEVPAPRELFLDCDGSAEEYPRLSESQIDILQKAGVSVSLDGIED